MAKIETMIPLPLRINTTEEDILALSPHLIIRRSKRARRMALRMDSHAGKMNLVLPERASLNKAYDFARQHRDWIARKMSDIPAAVPFAERAVIPLLGQNREIRLSATVKTITIDGDFLFIPPGRAALNTRVKRFLREEAKQTLSALAHEKAATINKSIKNVSVRDTKSRWGSCSADGTLSFSWRLIFAPWGSLDYVVAHEVAHLTHLNHSKDFWDLCGELSTDYETGKKWIRTHGHELSRYGLTEER